jgi:hypothetical protein
MEVLWTSYGLPMEQHAANTLATRDQHARGGPSPRAQSAARERDSRKKPNSCLLSVLEGYATRDFQSLCDDGMSKDWRDWHCGCHCYEGLLVDT